MELKLSLPIGIEDFKEVRKDGYYYVDKTALIEQVLEKRSKVTLFTRPRRFGKSLNISMLRNFFEIVLHLMDCIFRKILSYVKNTWESIL